MEEVLTGIFSPNRIIQCCAISMELLMIILLHINQKTVLPTFNDFYTHVKR